MEVNIEVRVITLATIEPNLVCFSSTINMSIASASLPWPARARAAGNFSSHAELGQGKVYTAGSRLAFSTFFKILPNLLIF